MKREVGELTGRVERKRDQMSLVFQKRDLLRKDFNGLVFEVDGLRLKEKEVKQQQKKGERD